MNHHPRTPDLSQTRFGRDMARARTGDLMSRSLFTDTERFCVELAGNAALPLSDDQRTQVYARLLAEGMDAAMAEDILIQMAAYLGYPRAEAALAALAAAGGEVSAPAAEEKSDDARYTDGTAVYGRINAGALDTIKGAFGEIAGDVIDLTFKSFGDVFATSSQPLALRQIATVAALGVLANAQPQLKFHMGAALNVGVSRDHLVETVIWVQFLAGMPAAYNALIALKDAISEGTDAPPGYN